MKIRRINWQIWTGFLLSVFAFASYPFIFAEWPITRDFPWASLLLFVLALVLVFIGVRRAFGRGLVSKIGASILTLLSVVVLGFFIMIAFVIPTWMPPAAGAPQIGAKAPDFTLADQNGRTTSLSELLTNQIESPLTKAVTKPRGVLLIFYRGYW
jgi:hypothetical protein